MPGQPGSAASRHKAVLVTITEAASVTAELRPFVEFKAALERRGSDPKDVVAIFKVHGTSSHFVVFMDAGKTMEDVDAEVAPYDVLIPNEARQRVAEALEARMLRREATG